jgi:hypothetical protein
LGSSSTEAAETRRRRIRIGVLCGVAAVVLAGGGVATAAALTGHSGGATVPPPAASVSVPTTTPKPQGAAPISHPPAEPADASATDGEAQPNSLRHKPTTTTSRKSGSGGGSGS